MKKSIIELSSSCKIYCSDQSLRDEVKKRGNNLKFNKKAYY